MKVRIEFNMDNAAFEDNGFQEIRRITHKAAVKADEMLHNHEYVSGALKDTNGNTVGSVQLLETEE